jgi:hypothetical protein
MVHVLSLILEYSMPMSSPAHGTDREAMASLSDRSDGVSGSEPPTGRGHASALPGAGSGGSPPPAPAGLRAASFVTAPPRLDAPRSTSGGGDCFGQHPVRPVTNRGSATGGLSSFLGMEPCSDLNAVPPGKALVAARALLVLRSVSSISSLFASPNQAVLAS